MGMKIICIRPQVAEYLKSVSLMAIAASTAKDAEEALDFIDDAQKDLDKARKLLEDLL